MTEKKRYFKQFLYNSNDIDKSESIDVFGKENYSVIQLGIQGYPGLYFQINKNAVINAANDIDFSSARLGGTGLFEIDLSQTTSRINSLTLDFQRFFPEQWATPIIVDIIYEVPEVSKI